MKFFTYLKAIFCICLVLGMAAHASADDISGTWVADVDGNNVEMTFKIDGTTLTGTVDIPASGSAEIRDGTVDGSKVSFHVLRKLSGFGDSEFKIVWTGDILEDEILFKREFAGTSKGVIARRKAAASDDQAKQKDTKSEAGPYARLEGKWSMTIPIGELLMDFHVEGTSLTGTVTNNQDRSAEIKEGKIEGDKLSFSLHRQRGANKFVVTWKGKITGDVIEFTSNFTANTFIARKVVEKAETQPEQKGPQDDTAAYDHLSGKWAGSTENGEMIIDLQVMGTSLTGTAHVKEMQPSDIINGKIEGDKITFTVNRVMMSRQLHAEWEGKIVGDRIQFTIHRAGGNIVKFVARKVKVDEKGQVKEEAQLPPTVDPSGTWVMEADGKQITMAFKAVGMSVTGLIKIPPQKGSIMISDAKISGDTISFSLAKRIGPNLFRIPFEGKVVGDEIHFDGGPFNKIENIIAKKIKGSDGNINDREPIKLVRDEEIKNSKVNKKYKKLRKKDSEYDFAMAYFDEYRYHLALPLLEQLYERLPGDAVLLHRLGVCLIMESVYSSDSRERKDMRVRARGLLEKSKKQGMENELLKYYLKVIPEDGGEDDIFSKQKEAEEVMKEAERTFGLKDYNKCLSLYAKTMELDPTNYKAVLYVGDSYFANGQYKDAVEWFERATKVDPNKETAWRFWGDCLLRMDKKEEGRLKFIDALIAEPYNQFTWNGIRNLVNTNRLKLEPPDIKRPQRLDATGELLVAEKDTGDSADDQHKSPPDGTGAWRYYNDVAREWRATKFKEKFTEENVYRHTLEEEREALELVAEKVNEDIKKGLIKSKDLNPGIKTLLELQASGMLEPYILFHLADREIIKDYKAYRKSNRDKLEQYLDRFEVPKLGDRRES